MNRELDPSRRYMTAKTFAKSIGVGRELIEGLVRGGQIDGVQLEGNSGGSVVMVYADQQDRLIQLMAAQT